MARMLAGARTVPAFADLADAAEEGAAIVIDVTMAEVEAVTSRLVPDETIRAAVLARLAERSDLVPWTRPFRFADDRERSVHTLAMASARTWEHMPDLASASTWETWKTTAKAWEGKDPDKAIGDDLTFYMSWGQSQGAIDALIPPADRDDVAAVIERSPGPPAAPHTPMEPSGPWGPLADGWHWKPAPQGTARLVAWFFLQETTPHRLAEHATRAILDKVDNAPELASRTLAREVEDHLERWGTEAEAVEARAVEAAPEADRDFDAIRAAMREKATEGVCGGSPSPPPPHPTFATGEDLDEALAGFLERIGNNGRAIANEKVRKGGKGRTPEQKAARWAPGAEPLRVARLLARALWFDVVAPRLQRQASRTDAPGMSMTALTSLMGMSRRGAQKELFHDAAVILDDKRRRVGSLRTVVEVDARHVNLADLNRLTTQRLIRWALHRGWDQKWVCDSPDPTRIVVDGGYPALALELGMKGKKAADELKGAVATLQSVFLQGPKGEGQVFAAWHHKASGQRRARLEMTLLGPFAPDYIARELAEHRNVNDKSVVPVPLPAHLPPLVGRERDHGSQAILQLLALRELRLRATELAADGAVDISARRWEDLRDEAGVPRATLADVLEAYPLGDGIRPAFMLQRDGRWDLAPDYSQERAAIVAAGEAMQKGKRGGEQAAANRRAGRAKPKTTRRAAK